MAPDDPQDLGIELDRPRSPSMFRATHAPMNGVGLVALLLGLAALLTLIPAWFHLAGLAVSIVGRQGSPSADPAVLIVPGMAGVTLAGLGLLIVHYSGQAIIRAWPLWGFRLALPPLILGAASLASPARPMPPVAVDIPPPAVAGPAPRTPKRPRMTLVASGGKALRLARREGLPAMRVGVGVRADRPLVIGDTVFLADDQAGRDIVVCADPAALGLTLAADFEGRHDRLARMAAEGRIFTVPRGTMAKVVDLVEGRFPGVVALEVRLDGSGEVGWITREFAR